MVTDDKKLEQKVRATLAQAVKDGSHYTQHELREKLNCDMNGLSRVLKCIVKDNLTRSLVVDSEVPVWLEKLLKQVGKGILKAIDERTKEDLAQRRIIADEALKVAQKQSTEYERQLQEKDARIEHLERQLQEAHIQIGEANGRRAEAASRLMAATDDVEKWKYTSEELDTSTVSEAGEQAAEEVKASTAKKH